MKKYIYLILSAVVLFSACNSTDDLYAELDEGVNGLSKDVVITLTDDDYELLDDPDDPDNPADWTQQSIANYKNFSSEDDVKEYVPKILALKYPHFGDGSSAIVTYNFYNGSSPDLRGDYFEATVSDAEYDALGYGRYDNFDDLESNLPDYAELKWGELTDGDYADVTHDYYNGSFTEYDIVSRVVYTVAYGWQYAWILPDDEYGDFFGESGTDFSDQDEGAEKMPVYLNEYHTLFKEAGDIMLVQYLFDDRCFGDGCDDPGEPNVPAVALYIFDGTEWLLYNDHYQVTPETLSFAYKSTVWVPDNTVKYELQTADYTWIVANYSDKYPLGADNMDTYGNFGATQWCSDGIDEVIIARLQVLFTPEEPSQDFLVTYSIYRGGYVDDVVRYRYSEGEWSVVEDPERPSNNSVCT